MIAIPFFNGMEGRGECAGIQRSIEGNPSVDSQPDGPVGDVVIEIYDPRGTIRFPSARADLNPGNSVPPRSSCTGMDGRGYSCPLARSGLAGITFRLTSKALPFWALAGITFRLTSKALSLYI